MKKLNKNKVNDLINYLDELSNKHKADVYKHKYLKTKRTLDEVAKHLGL